MKQQRQDESVHQSMDSTGGNKDRTSRSTSPWTLQETTKTGRVGPPVHGLYRRQQRQDESVHQSMDSTGGNKDRTSRSTSPWTLQEATKTGRVGPPVHGLYMRQQRQDESVHQSMDSTGGNKDRTSRSIQQSSVELSDVKEMIITLAERKIFTFHNVLLRV